jgi:hypothetical protein
MVGMDSTLCDQFMLTRRRVILSIVIWDNRCIIDDHVDIVVKTGWCFSFCARRCRLLKSI